MRCSAATHDFLGKRWKVKTGCRIAEGGICQCEITIAVFLVYEGMTGKIDENGIPRLSDMQACLRHQCLHERSRHLRPLSKLYIAGSPFASFDIDKPLRKGTSIAFGKA